jgi:hypothetical protein
MTEANPLKLAAHPAIDAQSWAPVFLLRDVTLKRFYSGSIIFLRAHE